MAAVGLKQANDHADGGRLSGALWGEEGVDFAAGDLERDVVHGHDPGAGCVEVLRELVDGDHGRGEELGSRSEKGDGVMRRCHAVRRETSTSSVGDLVQKTRSPNLIAIFTEF